MEELKEEVVYAINRYEEDERELSKNQVIAGVVGVAFGIFDIVSYFLGWLDSWYIVPGFLVVWCLGLVVIIPLHLRDLRIKMYKFVLSKNSSISIEEIAKMSGIGQQQLQKDLEFCAKYSLSVSECGIAKKFEPEKNQSTASQVTILTNRLKKVNEDITNAEIHKAMKNLIMVLENSKEVLENKGTDFLDTYVSKLIDVLLKYKG